MRPARRVRVHVLRPFVVEKIGLLLASRAGDPADRVHDRRRAHDVGEGQQRQQRRRRVASGARDERRARDLLATPLGESVDRVFDQLGMRMSRAVDRLVAVCARDPKVGRQVDDRDGAHEGADEPGGGPVRQRREDDVRVVRFRVFERDESTIGLPQARERWLAESGVDLTHARAGRRAGDRNDRLDLGMRGEDAHEHHTGVPGTAHDDYLHTPRSRGRARARRAGP